MTTETEFQKALKDELLADETEFIEDVLTFEEKMILSYNAGLVITLLDGSEFQVIIIKSR